MQIPISPIALGLLLAFGATPARAAPVEPPAAQPSTPLDLSLPAATTLPPGPADSLESASEEVRRVARWVLDSGDNLRMPFLVVDKVNAQVFAFGPAGQFRGTAPALLGMTRGDRLLAPNNAPMSAMSPLERITPAGRFVSRLAIDSHGAELLVLDYDASISLHAVVKGTPEEHRAERLASATVQDNRISFGCINVPAAFYSTIVSPTFTHTRGVVYVLPETAPASALFGIPDGSTVPGPQQASSSPGARPIHSVPAAGAR